MIRNYFLTGLVVAAAAVAVQAQTPWAQPPASPDKNVLPPDSMKAQGPNRPTPQQVAAMVNAQFPTRDADHNGSLNQNEFRAWVTELVTRRRGQNAMPPAELEQRAALAFTQADSDRNRGVSQGEMTALLSMGL